MINSGDLLITDKMDKLIEEIKASIKDDGKITCFDALKIAADNSVSPSEVGKQLNNMKLKVKGCQLGCFK